MARSLCSIAAAVAIVGCAERPATRPVAVRLVDHAGLMATVAGLRGRVVVLDCWSTSCPPCVREFLEGVGAESIDNMLGREESDVLYAKLDLASVPAVYVWDRDGSLVRRFDDDSARGLGRPFTYADVEATVRDLLAR